MLLDLQTLISALSILMRFLLLIPQNLYAPDPDPEMTIEKYERTFEQNEELGINDMKTENYNL